MSATLKCFTCRVEKDLSEFHKNQKKCRECFSVYARTRVAKEKEKVALCKDGKKLCIGCNQELDVDKFTPGKGKCRECINAYERERKASKKTDYKDPKDIIKMHSNQVVTNTSFIPIKQRNFTELTPEQKAKRDRICQMKREYYQKNKENFKIWHEKTRDRRNARLREKKKNDRYYAAISSLRVRTARVLHGKKDTTTDSLLGCNKIELRNWLTYQFSPGMDWSNYATVWHIDHVIPVQFFDTTNDDEKKAFFYWTNLKPLEKEANLSKSDSIVLEYIASHAKCVKHYICEILGYQATYENLWWPRFELGYGKNPTDIKNPEEFLIRAIRSQDPKPANDKGMDKVQRLDGDGSEESSQL